jgi:diamine N-acetyltransferase
MKNDDLYLRALEPDDLDFLYAIENHEEDWLVSQTQTPFSKANLKMYLENAHADIYSIRQLRLVICNASTAIGFVDLFDFCPKNRRAGVGIILSPNFRGKGFARKSLDLLIHYAYKHLHLHQLYAHIFEHNEASVSAFVNVGFVKTGVLREWFFDGNKFLDISVYQYFISNRNIKNEI